MNRLHEVANALNAILMDEVPEIPWVERVQGLNVPTELEGTFSCNGVTFSRSTVTSTECKADYVLYIIDPSEGKDDPRYIETLALKVRDVLSANSTLDNYATNSYVSGITFGTSRGGEGDISAAILKLTILFEIEEE